MFKFEDDSRFHKLYEPARIRYQENVSSHESTAVASEHPQQPSFVECESVLKEAIETEKNENNYKNISYKKVKHQFRFQQSFNFFTTTKYCKGRMTCSTGIKERAAKKGRKQIGKRHKCIYFTTHIKYWSLFKQKER